MAIRGLRGLIANTSNKPFSLSIHINAPHPPMVATSAYLDYYYSQKNNLFVSPSIKVNTAGSS